MAKKRDDIRASGQGRPRQEQPNFGTEDHENRQAASARWAAQDAAWQDDGEDDASGQAGKSVRGKASYSTPENVSSSNRAIGFELGRQMAEDLREDLGGIGTNEDGLDDTHAGDIYEAAGAGPYDLNGGFSQEHRESAARGFEHARARPSRGPELRADYDGGKAMSGRVKEFVEPAGTPAEPGYDQDEPYGAQVSRRLHEDSLLLLQEYDQMMPMLEHEGTKRLLTKTLQNLTAMLDALEQNWAKCYAPLGLAPLAGVEEAAPMTDAPPEGSPPPEGEEVANGPAPGIAPEEEVELSPEEEAAMIAEMQGGQPMPMPMPAPAMDGGDLVDSGGEDERFTDGTPGYEEAAQDGPVEPAELEFQEGEEFEAPGQKRALGKQLPRHGKSVRRKEMKQDEELNWGDEGLSEQEMLDLSDARAFLDALGEDTSMLMEDEKRLAFHHHKMLTRIMKAAPGSPEWAAEEMKEPEHQGNLFKCAKLLARLVHEKNFGDRHRHEIKSVRKSLFGEDEEEEEEGWIKSHESVAREGRGARRNTVVAAPRPGIAYRELHTLDTDSETGQTVNRTYSSQALDPNAPVLVSETSHQGTPPADRPRMRSFGNDGVESIRDSRGMKAVGGGEDLVQLGDGDPGYPGLSMGENEGQIPDLGEVLEKMAIHPDVAVGSEVDVTLTPEERQRIVDVPGRRIRAPGGGRHLDRDGGTVERVGDEPGLGHSAVARTPAGVRMIYPGVTHDVTPRQQKSTDPAWPHVGDTAVYHDVGEVVGKMPSMHPDVPDDLITLRVGDEWENDDVMASRNELVDEYGGPPSHDSQGRQIKAEPTHGARAERRQAIADTPTVPGGEAQPEQREGTWLGSVTRLSDDTYREMARPRNTQRTTQEQAARTADVEGSVRRWTVLQEGTTVANQKPRNDPSRDFHIIPRAEYDAFVASQNAQGQKSLEELFAEQQLQLRALTKSIQSLNSAAS